MEREEHRRAFLEKIESFKDEPEYDIMLQLRDRLLEKQNREDNLQQMLEARSLMDRIIVMPKSYIKSWLRNEHSLSYREGDKQMLQAFLSGYMDLQKEHINMEIHKISTQMLGHYLDAGYIILKKEGDIRYVGKRISHPDIKSS